MNYTMRWLSSLYRQTNKSDTVEFRCFEHQLVMVSQTLCLHVLAVQSTNSTLEATAGDLLVIKLLHPTVFAELRHTRAEAAAQRDE